VLLGTVVDIDPDSKQVHLEDGAILEYDSLVLAAGSQTSYFGRSNRSPLWALSRSHGKILRGSQRHDEVTERWLSVLDAWLEL
jgi:hypothetical protein